MSNVCHKSRYGSTGTVRSDVAPLSHTRYDESGDVGMRESRPADDGASEVRGCELYWASVSALSATHDRLLSPIEHQRRRSLRQSEDRARFALATILLRLAAGAWLGQPPERVAIDRTCDRCLQPHGRPRLPGTGLHASISHAGEYAAVALSDVAPVGVDIERIGRVAYAPLIDVVCTAAERLHVMGDADFYTYWTRKESVLKATGIGLSLPMTKVVVTPPTDAARVVMYDGSVRFAAQMFECSFDARYACAVTVLTDSPIPFRGGGAEGFLLEG
jgi:4'-phosphopantetheinyl transferase